MDGNDFGERLDLRNSVPRLVEEHLARYRYASRFVRGTRVLDLASGNGYGGKILVENGASSCVGVEIDAEAARTSGRHPSTGFHPVRASALLLPFRDQSFGSCMSVETIEHLEDGARFLAEIARILMPGGTLVVTTPNGASSEIPHNNPYHVKEYTASELVEMLRVDFDLVRLAGQYPARSGLRHRLREWLVGSRLAHAMRRALPLTVRTLLGESLAGRADVVEFSDLRDACPATMVIVATRR